MCNLLFWQVVNTNGPVRPCVELAALMWQPPVMHGLSVSMMLHAPIQQQGAAARSKVLRIACVAPRATHAVPANGSFVEASRRAKHTVDRASCIVTSAAVSQDAQHAVAASSPAPKAHRVVLKVADKEVCYLFIGSASLTLQWTDGCELAAADSS